MRARSIVAITLALVGCASRASCPSGELAPLAVTPAYVVVRSDYGSSAIALLAADGTLVENDWIDSGTRVSTLVTSLSGDVVLPTLGLGGGRIGWIERRNDVLTVARLDGSVEQIDVRGDASSANPHDVLALDDGRWLVARYDAHANDLALIEDGRLARRIGLDADETLTSPGCGTQCVALARPSFLLPLASGDARVILVGLDRLTAGFEAGTGAVLALDAASLLPSRPLELPGLENCFAAAPDPTDPARAWLDCSGRGGGTHDFEERRATAGLVEITLDTNGSLRESRRFQPGPSDPVPALGGLVPLRDGTVLFVSSGRIATQPGEQDIPDRLVALGPTGALRVIHEARTAFVLGEGVASADGALVPDADDHAILVLGPSDETIAIRSRTVLDDCVGLPPVEIAPL